MERLEREPGVPTGDAGAIIANKERRPWISID
jgi:hypothetical protein